LFLFGEVLFLFGEVLFLFGEVLFLFGEVLFLFGEGGYFKASQGTMCKNLLQVRIGASYPGIPQKHNLNPHHALFISHPIQTP
jgi:hypothetical protein